MTPADLTWAVSSGALLVLAIAAWATGRLKEWWVFLVLAGETLLFWHLSLSPPR